MPIIRRRLNRDFTTIRNDVFRDETLSLDALGLLCYLRSRPDDWTISQEQLRRRFGTGGGDARRPMGREQMQRIIRELIASGWVQREAARTGRGAFGGVDYVVLDEPEKGPVPERDRIPVASLPQSGFPTAGGPAPESDSPTPGEPWTGEPWTGEPWTGEPEAGDPESVNPTAYLILDSTKGFSPLNPPVAGGTRPIEERISEREALAGRRPDRSIARRPRAERGCRGPAPPAVPPGPDTLGRFERLWAAFPPSGRLTAGRAEALARFAELAPSEQETAIRTAMAYAASCAELRSQAKALHRWLRDERWRNGAPSSAAARPGGDHSSRVFVREGSPEWDAWAEHYRREGKPMPTPIWSTANRADGWYFPAALPPAPEKVA